MNLESHIIGDSRFLDCKPHKALVFCLLPIMSICPLTPTPAEAVETLEGQSPQTFTPQAYLETSSMPNTAAGLPTTPGNSPALSWVSLLQVPLGYRNLLFPPFLI